MRKFRTKLITITLASALLAACGGDDPIEDCEETSTCSSSSTTSSSTTSSNSSIVSSTSSNSWSSTPTSDFGDIANGRSILKGNRCVGCHQDENDDGVFSGLARIDVDELLYADASAYNGKYADQDFNSNTIEGLAAFISFAMPPSGQRCNDQCAKDASAYLWSLRDGIPGAKSSVTSCPTPDAIHYGRRALRMLTSYEYQNSLQNLFHAPLPGDYASSAKISSDRELANLPNHILLSMSEDRMNKFGTNAAEIAKWAANNGNALGFSCNSASICADDFITEFLYVAFRRPPTSAERAEYRAMITEAENLNRGLEWAIRTAIMSPQFLYRSEQGTMVKDALNAPPIEPLEKFDFANTPVTYTAADLSKTVLPLYERLASDSGLDYSFTGNDLVRITISATRNDNGDWPTLRFGANGQDIAEFEVAHGGARTYSFHVESLTGNQYIFFENRSTGSHNPGHTVVFESVQFGTAKEAEPPEDNREKLLAADQNAYVLDAFEYASTLAFMYTGSAPSRQLLDAAARGELFDESSLSQHIDELMNSPKGQEHIGRIAGFWFRTNGVIDRPKMNVPAFTQEVRESMAQEIREMFKYVFYNNLPFTALFKGDFTMLDSTLAQFYGLSGGGSSHMDFEYFDTSGTNRGGVLASGAYMANNAHMDHTSPILRSVHMRQDFLCQIIPLPIALNDEEVRKEAKEHVEQLAEQGSLTDADFFDIQTNVEGTSCAECHNAIINPLFAMDDFDHVGRLRPRDGNQVVQKSFTQTDGPNIPIEQVNNGGYLYAYNAVGQLNSNAANAAKQSGDGLWFSGAKSLSQLLVDNNLPGVEACFIEKVSRFAMGYTLNVEFLDLTERNAAGIQFTPEVEKELVCIKDDLATTYSSSNASPRAVLKAIGMSDMMRFRR